MSLGPIFVVGNSRSGTTMMARMLGRHSRIYSFGELHFVERLVSVAALSERSTLDRVDAERLVGTLLSVERNGLFTRPEPGQFREEAGTILAEAGQSLDAANLFEVALRYEARRHGKEVPCEQTPRNLFYLDELLELYPNARAINMVRDPRDVMLSQKHKWRRRFLGGQTIPLSEAIRAWVNYHPITIARLWRGAVRFGERFQANNRVQTVRFEDVLANPRRALSSICKGLGLEFEDAVLDVPQVGSSLGQDSALTRGVDPSRTGKWRGGGLNNAELTLCQTIAGDCMRRYGYNIEPVVRGELRVHLYKFTWLLKLALALVVNWRRVKNLPQAIRRRLL